MMTEGPVLQDYCLLEFLDDSFFLKSACDAMKRRPIQKIKTLPFQTTLEAVLSIDVRVYGV